MRTYENYGHPYAYMIAGYFNTRFVGIVLRFKLYEVISYNCLYFDVVSDWQRMLTSQTNKVLCAQEVYNFASKITILRLNSDVM